MGQDEKRDLKVETGKEETRKLKTGNGKEKDWKKEREASRAEDEAGKEEHWV
jgi:hypothetical protein